MSKKNVIVAVLVVALVSFSLWLHQLELDRRELWMDKIEAFKAEMEAFKADVDSQVHDRWTETEHNNREQEVFNALFRDNSELSRPSELTFEIESVEKEGTEDAQESNPQHQSSK